MEEGQNTPHNVTVVEIGPLPRRLPMLVRKTLRVYLYRKHADASKCYAYIAATDVCNMVGLNKTHVSFEPMLDYRERIEGFPRKRVLYYVEFEKFWSLFRGGFGNYSGDGDVLIETLAEMIDDAMPDNWELIYSENSPEHSRFTVFPAPRPPRKSPDRSSPSASMLEAPNQPRRAAPASQVEPASQVKPASRMVPDWMDDLKEYIRSENVSRAAIDEYRASDEFRHRAKTMLAEFVQEQLPELKRGLKRVAEQSIQEYEQRKRAEIDASLVPEFNWDDFIKKVANE